MCLLSGWNSNPSYTEEAKIWMSRVFHIHRQHFFTPVMDDHSFAHWKARLKVTVSTVWYIYLELGLSHAEKSLNEEIMNRKPRRRRRSRWAGWWRRRRACPAARRSSRPPRWWSCSCSSCARSCRPVWPEPNAGSWSSAWPRSSRSVTSEASPSPSTGTRQTSFGPRCLAARNLGRPKWAKPKRGSVGSRFFRIFFLGPESHRSTKLQLPRPWADLELREWERLELKCYDCHVWMRQQS